MVDGFSGILDFPNFFWGGLPDPPFKGNTSVKSLKSLFNNNNCQTKKSWKALPDENSLQEIYLQVIQKLLKGGGRWGKIFIAPLWKSGGYTGFALSFCHSVTLWFCHSVTFQMKIFVTLFSGTVRPRTLKLGTHMDSGQMYRVYWNQAAASYSSFYFFIFLSLNFSSHFSQELWGLDVWNLVHPWTVGRCIVYTAAYSSLYFFIFLSLNFHFFLFLKFLVHNMSFSSDSAIAGL